MPRENTPALPDPDPGALPALLALEARSEHLARLAQAEALRTGSQSPSPGSAPTQNELLAIGEVWHALQPAAGPGACGDWYKLPGLAAWVAPSGAATLTDVSRASLTWDFQMNVIFLLFLMTGVALDAGAAYLAGHSMLAFLAGLPVALLAGAWPARRIERRSQNALRRRFLDSCFDLSPDERRLVAESMLDDIARLRAGTDAVLHRAQARSDAAPTTWTERLRAALPRLPTSP